MMKRIWLLTAATVLLMASGAFAQYAVNPNYNINLGRVAPLYAQDTLQVGQTVTFYINFVDTGSSAIFALSNGWRVYSEDGATWDTTTVRFTNNIPAPGIFDGKLTNIYSVDGQGADTVGVVGYVVTSPGLPVGFNDSATAITIGPISPESHGKHICLDSSFFRPAGEWLWGDNTDGAVATWSGPYCFTVFDPDAQSAPNMTVTPGTLTFNTVEGVNPANQLFSVTSDGDPLTVTISDDAPWLSTSVSGGTTPLNPSAIVNVAGLGAGQYNGTITVASAGAANSPQIIAVTLNVEAAPISNLVATPNTLTFNAQEGGANPANQPFALTSDNQALSFSISDDATWLSVDPTSGTTPSNPSVAVNIAGLSDGVYNGTITITSAGADNSPITVNVTLNVSAAPSNLILSPTELEFTAVEGGPAPGQQDFTVGSNNDPLNYTITDDATWLSVNPTSGVTTSGVSPLVNVDQTGLSAGVYNAIISVASAGAANSPQTISVTLTVTAAPVSNLVISPSSLEFTAEQGGPAPADQNISVGTDNETLNFSVSDDASWLTVNPTSGETPQSLTVSVDQTGLAPDLYTATVTITSAGADNSPRTVAVSLNVTEAPGSNLVVSPTTLNFTAVAGGPAPDNQNVSVSSDNATVNFQLADNATWLTVNPTFGETPQNLTVSVDQTGLVPDLYTATITISSAEADNSPQVVNVNLTVTPANEWSIVSSTPTSICDPLESDTITLDVTGANTEFTVGIEGVRLLNGSTHDAFNVNVLSDTHLLADFAIPSGSVGTYDLLVQGIASSATLADAFTVTARSVLAANPTSLHFEYTIGGSAPAAQAFEVSTTGEQISFFINGADDWVTPSPTFGETPETIEVSVNPAGFEPGSYVDTLVISGTCAAGDLAVEISLNVVQAPAAELHMSPTSLSFSAVQGEANPAAKALVLTSSGAELDFLLSHEMEWLMLSANSGNTPESVLVSVDIAGLAPGVYHDTIVATSEAAENDPLATVVTLTIAGDVGENQIVVGTAPAVPGAQVVVPVNFTNGCDLFALSTQIEWHSEYLHLDSATYAGSRVEGFLIKEKDVNNDSNYVRLWVAEDLDGAAPGEGLFASLFFTVSPMAMAGFYDLTFSPVVAMTSPNDNPRFTLDCGAGEQVVIADTVSGAIVVGEQPNFTCGYVVDDEGQPIEGATVELWADFPYDGAAMTTTTDPNGYYSFSDFTINPFDIYAYKSGYYPDKEENLNFGCYGTLLELVPLREITPTYEWVNFYCDGNTYMDAPLPVGSVVEAMDPNGVLCGRFVVAEPGKYGFLPVYRDDPFAPHENTDEGCLPGDNVSFYVNGTLATASGQTIWTQNGDAFEVCLDAGNAVTKVCALAAGWNLVSWNLDTESDDIENVLASLGDNLLLVLGFEQGALTYDPELPQFSTLWNVDHLSGYWIKVAQAANLEISGMSVPASTPIPVTTGWNLVSYLPGDSRDVELALASLNGNLLVALGFDGTGLTYQPGQEQFNTLDEMMPCFGYWVKVGNNDALTYDDDQQPLAGVREFLPSKASGAYVNADGVMPTRAWINAYSYDLRLDGRQVTAGSEVAAYTLDGIKIGSYKMASKGKFGFMPIYSDDPTTSDVEGVKKGEAFTISIDGVQANETFTWTDNGDKLEFGNLTSARGGQALPNTFALEQNYPNPFNPSTNINFRLPEAGQAKVEVFDILGHKVAEPFNGFAEAGPNSVVWNGRNRDGQTVASGVYFYRLTFGTFVDTKKMTLLK